MIHTHAILISECGEKAQKVQSQGPRLYRNAQGRQTGLVKGGLLFWMTTTRVRRRCPITAVDSVEIDCFKKKKQKFF